MSSKPYNGYPSWAAWNVSLWIHNTESLYRLALECIKAAKLSGKSMRWAAEIFTHQHGEDRTPDGARYSLRSVTYALRGLDE